MTPPKLPERLALGDCRQSLISFIDDANRSAGGVCTCSAHGEPFAQELVRRWNSHAALVAFVERVARADDVAKAIGSYSGPLKEVAHDARMLLAKVSL